MNIEVGKQYVIRKGAFHRRGSLTTVFGFEIPLIIFIVEIYKLEDFYNLVVSFLLPYGNTPDIVYEMIFDRPDIQIPFYFLFLLDQDYLCKYRTLCQTDVDKVNLVTEMTFDHHFKLKDHQIYEKEIQNILGI